jgi:hypothetical protein
VLAQALADVDPQRVYLFAIDPDLDDERAFLTRLGGLAKRSLRADGGQVSLTRLAAATAQQAETVEAGIAWLVAHGDLIVTERQGDDVTLALGTGQRREDLLVAATKALRGQLQETAAYRRHVRGADKDVLIA